MHTIWPGGIQPSINQNNLITITSHQSIIFRTPPQTWPQCKPSCLKDTANQSIKPNWFTIHQSIPFRTPQPWKQCTPSCLGWYNQPINQSQQFDYYYQPSINHILDSSSDLAPLHDILLERICYENWKVLTQEWVEYRRRTASDNGTGGPPRAAKDDSTMQPPAAKESTPPPPVPVPSKISQSITHNNPDSQSINQSHLTHFHNNEHAQSWPQCTPSCLGIHTTN